MEALLNDSLRRIHAPGLPWWWPAAASMTDERLRTLERRWRTSRRPEDHGAFLLDCVRAGVLTHEALTIAAYCGHEGAMSAAGLRPQPLVPPFRWLRELERVASAALQERVVMALLRKVRAWVPGHSLEATDHAIGLVEAGAPPAVATADLIPASDEWTHPRWVSSFVWSCATALEHLRSGEGALRTVSVGLEHCLEALDREQGKAVEPDPSLVRALPPGCDSVGSEDSNHDNYVRQLRDRARWIVSEVARDAVLSPTLRDVDA